jgi:hypothetical protein
MPWWHFWKIDCLGKWVGFVKKMPEKENRQIFINLCYI